MKLNSSISTKKMVAALLAIIMCLSITAVNAFAANSNVAGDGTSTATSVSEYDYMRMVNTGFYSWIGDAAAGNGTLDAVKYPIEYDKYHYVTGCRESAESTGICGFNMDSDHPKNVTDDVKWTLKDGTLTIYGNGNMHSYGVDWFGMTSPFAWNPHIEHVVVEKGVDVRSTWFAFMPNLKTITLPAGEHVSYMFRFYNCPKLETVTVDGYVMPLESLRHYDVYNKYRCDYYVVPGISDDANICNDNNDIDSTKYGTAASLSMEAIKAAATGTVSSAPVTETPVADNTSTVGSSNEDLSTMNSSELAVLLKQAMAEGDMERAQEILGYMRANKEQNQQEAAERAEQEAQEQINKQNDLIGNKKVADWAREFVALAVKNGIVPETGLGDDYTKPITRAQFCALGVKLYETATGNAITGRSSFDDTNDINVEKLASLGIVNGYGNGKFGPNDTLTRAAAATMLVRIADNLGIATTVKDTNFTDVASNHWASEFIARVGSIGVMNGTSATTFHPENHYTIEQSIVTIYRLLMVNNA